MENTCDRYEYLEALPNELLSVIISFIDVAQTVLNFASTSKKLNSQLHSKKFWQQHGGDRFKKYAAHLGDQLPSYIIPIIIHSKNIKEVQCECTIKLDRIFPDLIPKLLTSNDMTEIENSLNLIDEGFCCLFCDSSPLYKIVFSGLVPKYIQFMSSQFKHPIPLLAVLMLKRLSEADFLYSTAVVRENGIDALSNAILSKYGNLAVDSLGRIIKNCPAVADTIFRAIIEPIQGVLSSPNRSLEVYVTNLLTACVKRSREADPQKFARIIPRIIELMLPMDGSLVDIGLPFELFAYMVAISHNHPSIVQLTLNDAVIRQGITLLPYQDEVFLFFKEILKYDPLMADRLHIEEILDSMRLLEQLRRHSIIEFLTQLLENSATLKKRIKQISKRGLVAKMMSTETSAIGLYQLLFKLFLKAKDVQIQQNFGANFELNLVCFSTMNIVLKLAEESPALAKRKKKEKFTTKMFKMIAQWRRIALNTGQQEMVQHLDTLIQKHFSEVQKRSDD